MATNRAVLKVYLPVLDTDRHDRVGLVLSAALPLAVFIIVHGLGQMTATVPFFFAPFGLPGWAGAVLHLSGLPLLGVARWMASRQGHEGRRAGWWVVALMAGLIGLPFVVGSFDTLALTMISFVLLFVGLGAMVRVARVDGKAALVMAPVMVWLGLGAFVGLSFSAAWAPPFAVANSQIGA